MYIYIIFIFDKAYNSFCVDQIHVSIGIESRKCYVANSLACNYLAREHDSRNIHQSCLRMHAAL